MTGEGLGDRSGRHWVAGILVLGLVAVVVAVFAGDDGSTASAGPRVAPGEPRVPGTTTTLGPTTTTMRAPVLAGSRLPPRPRHARPATSSTTAPPEATGTATGRSRGGDGSSAPTTTTSVPAPTTTGPTTTTTAPAGSPQIEAVGVAPERIHEESAEHPSCEERDRRVTVTARITDPDGVDRVEIEWSEADAAGDTEAGMARVERTDTWTATVGPFPLGTAPPGGSVTVEVTVRAWDLEGNGPSTDRVTFVLESAQNCDQP